MDAKLSKIYYSPRGGTGKALPLSNNWPLPLGPLKK